jgi:uncharacterized protein (DUF302 family)
MQKLIVLFILFALIGCAGLQTNTNAAAGDAAKASASVGVDANSAIYEVQVADGVSYQDVVDSLKSVSEGMNFVNPANFPIGDHIKLRGIDPQGIKVVHSFCNLTMGTDIFLDHPEFLVFAPCRIAIYEKPDVDKKLKLFIGLARPSYDLKSIKTPTARAQKAAQELEDALIKLLDKARKGDI